MEKLTHIGNVTINFEEYNTSKNWIKDFPTDKWCLLVIADEKKITWFSEIINKSIDRNVGCIFSVGRQHNFIHDIADEELTIREVEDLYLPDHLVITVGDENVENGICDAIYVFARDENEINQIVILDTTQAYKSYIVELLKKFIEGYIPPLVKD